MNCDGVTPDIAAGLLVMKDRIKAALFYIAEILTQFDLIGLVELRDDLSDLKAILEILGSDSRAIYADTIPDAGGNRERVAYLYDRRGIVFNGLAAQSPLRFELIEVFRGAGMICLFYRSVTRDRRGIERFRFDDAGLVSHAAGIYGEPE